MKRSEYGRPTVQKAARNLITLDRALALTKEIAGDREAVGRYRRLVESGCGSAAVSKDFMKRVTECDRLIARKESELERLLRPR